MKNRCLPWRHDWRKIHISGGINRSLWRCRKCPVIKAKGQ